MLCAGISADSVVARLKLRMTGMKCVPLATETDRNLIDAAVQEAQQQGATVREHFRLDVANTLGWIFLTFNG